jgi:hypothetical protein
MPQETAALRDFNAAYVGLGSKSDLTGRKSDFRLTLKSGLSSDMLLGSMKATRSQSIQTHWVRYIPIA